MDLSLRPYAAAAGGPFGGHATLTDGLVSYWKLDETSGTRFDVHGSNDLTDNNTVGFAAGKNGNAATYVGGNAESLSLAAASADTAGIRIIAGGTISFAGWWQVNAGVTGDHVILGRWPGNGWTVINQSNGEVVFHIFNGDGNDSISTGAGTVNYGTGWHHLVMTYNGTTAVIRVDDTLTASAAHGGGTNDTAQNFRFGQNNDGGGLATGTAYGDESCWWSRVITAQEITDLYNSGLGLFY